MFSENYEDILRAAAKQICDYVEYRYAHPQTEVSITGVFVFDDSGVFR